MNFGTKIDHSSGAEGPDYDPYHYEEWSVNRNGKEATLHLGLDVWLEIDNKRQVDHDDGKIVIPLFEHFCGINLENLMSAYYRSMRICSTCKRITLDSEMSGFPGETFLVCAKCGNIKYTHFNESAII